MVARQEGVVKMTPDRQQEIQDFKQAQQEAGGIILSKLAGFSTVLVETKDFMYSFCVHITAAGRRYRLKTIAENCGNSFICVDIRSHSGRLQLEMEDWIGKDMQLILKFTNGKSVITGLVLGATVIGIREDGSEFNYGVWD